MNLPDLLHPLPVHAVGALLLAFHRREGNAALIHAELQDQGLLPPTFALRWLAGAFPRRYI